MKLKESLLYKEEGRLIFWAYSFKIYQDRIEAYFTPHKQVISFSDIKSVELVEKIPWTVGRGLRYGIPRTKHSGIKYFVIRGEGIRLRLKSGRWKKIVLSVKEPQKVKSLIEERLEPSMSEMGLVKLAETA
ncbi:MAG: hypothetical protein ACFFD8_03320 [Candidatus Thorarchaeota archaeon]